MIVGKILIFFVIYKTCKNFFSLIHYFAVDYEEKKMWHDKNYISKNLQKGRNML